MGTTTRSYFLWDYDLTENDVLQILQGDNENEKTWMISRIMESARYADIWNYITLEEVRKIFPKLRLKPPVRQAWEFALHVWGKDEQH